MGQDAEFTIPKLWGKFNIGAIVFKYLCFIAVCLPLAGNNGNKAFRPYLSVKQKSHTTHIH